MTGQSADRLARAALSCVIEPGDARCADLLAHLGPKELLAKLREESRNPELRKLRENFAARLDTADAEQLLRDAAAAGIRFVTPEDPEWPAGVDDLVHAPVLYERGGAPIGLWVRGSGDLAQLASRAVAVVGSRSATTYGATLARDIAAGVARAGYTVVSGGAFGIDQAAHRGALTVDGGTIAVLACGADRVYPEAHRPLLDHIAERGGVVVSETPPGGAPTRIRFLSRNRLIAALAGGTVVVEAAVRSGALNTATWAAGLGRQLMGVPGPVTSAASEGVHQLIRARGAVLVTRAEEVLEVVAPTGTFILAEPREQPRLRDGLQPQQLQVLDAVPAMTGAGLDSIARVAGLAPQRTSALLEELYRARLVERTRDNRWRLSLSGRGRD